jgi:hypothetical protein
MAARVETNHAWLENIIHQANKMSEVEFMLGLGGPIAGLKALTTKTFEFCAREATQVFHPFSFLDLTVRFLVDWLIVVVDKVKK